MSQHHNSRHKNFDGEDKRNLSKKERLFQFLQTGLYTATQCEMALGIRSGSMCLLRKALRDEGRLYVGEEVNCPVTGHRARLITTNPSLISIIEHNKQFREEIAFMDYVNKSSQNETDSPLQTQGNLFQ